MKGYSVKGWPFLRDMDSNEQKALSVERRILMADWPENKNS